MIKITSTNDVIIVEGDELTRHYPYNGTLVIPKNSTLVLLDESSEMVLFKSASNYDTLFTGILGSIYIEDELVTRENIIEKFNAISNVIVGGNVGLFEVVQSLPTQNISDNKVYLVLDSNGSEGNIYVEYLYVNGQWEELGKFKVNVDLSGYATEDWVNSQGFLKEHQDVSNLATKAELATKQDTISDLETIRSGAAKGATALQSVPDTYALKTDILTAKTDTRYTTFEVQNPVLSGKTILLQNEATDSRKYHTFGFDKTYSTTSSNGLLNGSTPLYRDSNEYNCPQWDGNTIRFTYQEGNEVYTTLKIPYTYNGIKYVTHICTNVYNDSVRMVPYPYIDDDNFPDYQIVQFKDSEIYNTYRSYGTFGIDVNGEMQNYDSEPNSPTNFSSIVMPGYTVEITVRNFPLNASNGELEIETPRFYLSSNNVLTGDVPTEEETSNAPERLNDYIRYANNVKAYILTDKNTTFKTINGQQITGNGDITIDTNVDLTGYATKEELNAKQDTINDLDTIRSGSALGATALQSVPSEYATEQWVNEQGFLKEHQDISNLATKAELATKQDTISDLDTIRSGAALGATALQSVPDTYALKTDILSAKTDSRYTDYYVQNPLLSGNTIVLQNEVTDSRKYHTLGFDKTVETTEIGDVRKYVDFNREFDSSGDPIIRTNFDNYENIPLDFSNITDDGDVYIIYYYGSFVNFENGTEGESFYSYITYNKNTKILKAIDNELITSNQFKRSDTGEYIFDTSQMQFDCNQLQNGAYLIWSIYVSPGLYYRFNASTAGKLFVGEISTTSPTSRFPQNKNEFFRYENDVKAYILTDKNTTFKTINGQQITGNGDITIDTNVDLSNYATKSELNTKQDVISDLETIRSGAAKGATALQSVPNTYALKSEIPDITTKQDTLVSGTNIKTINGTSLLGSGNIEVAANVDLSGYATKEELNAKQDTLVSGTNIKTINGTSLLGSGNIEVAANVDLSSYATEEWVNSQGFLKEHQDISNLATKSELNAKQDVISDLDSIRSGAALGATALQSVPNTYALKSEIPDITTKQDTLVSGTNIKTINGTSLLGSGNIEVAKEWIGTQAQYDALSTKDNNTTYYITE